MTRAQEKAETLAFLADPNRVTFYEPRWNEHLPRPLKREEAESEEAWMVEERERRGQEIARLMRTLLPISTLPRMSVPCRVCGKVLPSYDWSRHVGWTGKGCAGRPVEARKPKTQGKTRAKRQNVPNRTLDPLRWPNLARFDAEMRTSAIVDYMDGKFEGVAA